jgi:catechol 2,3-dioxygenase-like lactoylglutathione lyase family enzyme
MKINGINHVTVVVKDKAKAAEFYFDKLGLERIDVGKSLWALVGSQFIHINENQNMEYKKTFAHFGISVENLPEYLEILKSNGIDSFDLTNDLQKFDVNKNYERAGRSYFIEDPFGNFIEILDVSNPFFKQ